MENPFVFDWMFDILSLGTTYLYRKYMIGAHLTMMLAAEEDVWRVPPTWDDVTAESPFQSAYDELDIDLDSKHPSRHLNRWPDEREEDEFELRQDDDKRLSIEVCKSVLLGYAYSLTSISDRRTGGASHKPTCLWGNCKDSRPRHAPSCCDHNCLVFT